MPPRRSSLLTVLTNRNFLLLWTAYFISATGDHLSELAILRMQNAMAGGVDSIPLQARMQLVFFLPFFLLGPVMGFVSDRASRRSIMLLADLLRAAVMMAFAGLVILASPLSSGWGPFLPLFVLGVLAAMFSPAQKALLPALVADEQLVSANALIRGVGVLATVVSTLLGGWIADHVPWIAFEADAVTFLLSAACIYAITVARRPGPPVAEQRGMLSEIHAGVRYVWHHRRVRQIFVVGTVFWFCAAVVRSVVPAVVKSAYQSHLYKDVSLMFALLAIGMVIGSIALAWYGVRVRSEAAVSASLVAAGIAAVGFGLTTIVPLSPRVAFVAGGVSIAALGACGAVLIASYNTLLQRIVPDGYLGRVFGVMDGCTTAGLLVACGLLGVPDWPGLDAWAGAIVLLMAALLLGSGLGSYWQRSRDTRRWQTQSDRHG